jgi:hypothetical protein
LPSSFDPLIIPTLIILVFYLCYYNHSHLPFDMGDFLFLVKKTLIIPMNIHWRLIVVVQHQSLMQLQA